MVHKKYWVTVASEAFGLVVLTNCEMKWHNIFEFKVNNPGAKIPESGDEALPFKGKWTDSKCGRIVFGGWDEEAFTYFEDYKEKVEIFRTTDAANGFDTQNYALSLMRTTKGIEQDAPGKKRKRTKKGTPPKPVAARKITRKEE